MKAQHHLTDSVKLLQKAVLIHQGKMLLLRRSEHSKTRKLQWDLPGGNSEWPTEKTGVIRDLHIVDLKREILEETGISADEFVNAPQLVSFETSFEAEKNVYTIIAGWKIELASTFVNKSILLSDEHDQFVWVHSKDISDFDFGFAGGGEGFITRIIANSFTG